MATLYDSLGLEMANVPYEEAALALRQRIKEHIEGNPACYRNNVPISLANYFTRMRKQGKMSKELQEIESLTYGLLALLSEEDPYTCSEKALQMVGDEERIYDDGTVHIEIYRLNGDWIRLDYESCKTDEMASIQAFSLPKGNDRLLHYEAHLQKRKTREAVDYSINLISISETPSSPQEDAVG